MTAPILPSLKPPPRSTTHGARMTERAARLWEWLGRRGVQLGDFSTDACVLRAMPSLLAARADLEAELSVCPSEAFASTLRDLQTLIDRTPAARVTAPRR